ncbi:PEP-CTERM sorting domain-containing protein [Edaphobacter aggregans]|uniref:PEP-CTERM sorting domain-containing protein n=1 Tax=Edaphobacter aggregans TaxID=570835 RepID=UPI000551D268|nr:PEP-CTERM sorting domain-containing protein [Edaphobacter aggregans]
MRKILSALVLILGLAVVPAAHASPITYNLTLTSFGGLIGGNVAGGTGSITLDDTPGSGFDFFSQPGVSGNRITSLSFNIGGDIFTLADTTSLTWATFFNGALAGLHYDGSLTSGKVDNDFDTISLFYAYNDDLTNKNSVGTISANVASATAPEPSALLLFGSGALGLVGFASRKFAA